MSLTTPDRKHRNHGHGKYRGDDLVPDAVCRFILLGLLVIEGAVCETRELTSD